MLNPCSWQDGTGPAWRQRPAISVHGPVKVGHPGGQFNLVPILRCRMTRPRQESKATNHRKSPYFHPLRGPPDPAQPCARAFGRITTPGASPQRRFASAGAIASGTAELAFWSGLFATGKNGQNLQVYAGAHRFLTANRTHLCYPFGVGVSAALHGVVCRVRAVSRSKGNISG